MSSLVIRCIKVLCFLVLFVYLSLVGLLNLPPVRFFVQQKLQTQVNSPVSQGYLYLNWKFNPVLSSLTINPAPSVKDKNTLTLNNLELNINWSLLWQQGFKFNRSLSAWLDCFYIRQATMGIVNFSAQNRFGEQSKFKIPVWIDDWKVNFIPGEDRIFTLRGKNIDYSPDTAPVTAKITRLLGTTAKIDVRFSTVPEWALTFDVEKCKLPFGLLKNIDNLWQGKINVQRKEGKFYLHSRLSGYPLKFKDFQAGTMKIRTDFSTDTAGRISADTLGVSGPYFSSNWEGFLRNKAGEIDLSGEARLNVKKLLGGERLFGNYPLKILNARPVFGEFSLRGNPLAPHFEGKVFSPGLRFSVRTWQDSRQNVEIRDWEGSWQNNRLRWNSGSIYVDNIDFDISSGFIGFRSQSIISSLTGRLVKRKKIPPGTENSVLTNWFGDFSYLDLPLNLSFVADASSLQAALAARGGQIKFSKGNFDNIWMLGSYNSERPKKTGISGRFRDPYQNDWTVSGQLDGPLRFKSTLERYRWTEGSVFSKIISDNRVRLKKLQAMFQFNRPFENWKDYYGYLNFDDGQISTSNFRIPGLGGEIEVTPQQIDFENFYATGNFGKISFQGKLNHSPDFTQKDLEVLVVGKNLEGKKLLRKQKNFDFSGLDFELNTEGKLSSPRFSGEVSFGELRVGQVKVRRLESELITVEQQKKLIIKRGVLGKGELSGQLKVGPRFGGEVDLEVAGAQLKDIFAGEDQLTHNIHGKITVELLIKGRYTELDSWNGQVNLAHSELIMDSFPVVGGLDKVANLEKIGNNLKIEPGQNNLKVKEGKLIIDNFRLQAKDVKLNGAGEIDFDGSLDTDYRLILTGEAVKRYLQDVLGDLYRKIGIGEERKIVIEFTIKGFVTEPNVSINRDKTTRNFRQNLVNSILSEVLGKPVNEILDVFFD